VLGVGLVLISLISGLVFRATAPKQSVTSIENSDGAQRLTSFYQNKNDYNDAFDTAITTTTQTRHVLAAVTSHHFLAKEVIARTMTGINPGDIKNVIIVSPDHFNAISDAGTLGVTTADNWDTPFGSFEANPGQIKAVSTLRGITIQRSLFLKEHGIYTLVPFLKKQFPDVRIIPLVLKSSDSYTEYEQLGVNLHQIFNSRDTLLLISSDFSHDVSTEVATDLDIESIKALTSHTLGDVPRITSDCKVCMAMLFGYLSKTPTTFQLVENKNSFIISGQDRDRVTSYVSGYFTEVKKDDRTSQLLQLFAENPHSHSHGDSDHQSGEIDGSGVPETSGDIKLLFGGDLMFDRSIRLKMKEYGNEHIFKDLKSLFAEQTVVIANLEGPVTDHPSRSVGSAIGSTNNFIFTFDPSVASTLFDAGIHVVNLGNNHIKNFGVDGVTQTKQFLQKKNVQYFGDTGTELSTNERTVRMERNGITIGLVNYNQFTMDGMEHARSDLAAIRPTVDLVILYTHWGNEYVPKANEVIQTQAHRFIDAGADLIIGSHPHVIQNVEEYKGKRIYYSLGNLVFDQYFSPETQKGMLVGVSINPETKQLTFKEYTVQLKPNGQTLLLSSP